MTHKFQLGESVIYISGGFNVKKGKVVLYKEEELDDGSIDVTYRVKSEDGNMTYLDEWELERIWI